VAHRVCPWWLGYLLASPLRRLMYDPAKILATHVRPGMTVLEPGPGMGFFTLELARLVGPSGRVLAVELQPKMLEGLKRRAAKANLLGRVDARLGAKDSMGLTDVSGTVDFALVFAVVHEMPDAGHFFSEVSVALKQGAYLLLSEPAGHVKAAQFNAELEAASQVGLKLMDRPLIPRSHAALLQKL
jgi:tRNA A58 N-methylase Trm61